MIGFETRAHRRAVGVCALLALAGLTACVAPPSYRNRPVAAGAPSTFVLAHAAIVEEPRHATRHLDDAKTIVYTQTQGGSLTAGLVFRHSYPHLGRKSLGLTALSPDLFLALNIRYRRADN